MQLLLKRQYKDFKISQMFSCFGFLTQKEIIQFQLIILLRVFFSTEYKFVEGLWRIDINAF